jgi:Zn-dependent M16 (insulinase) family peptidase
MKGAMSSPTSLLWQTLTRHLYPTTTYHYNSGGEPDCIPHLSHTSNCSSSTATHYHPSNAIFMTYGNLASGRVATAFRAQALHRFEAAARSCCRA